MTQYDHSEEENLAEQPIVPLFVLRRAEIDMCVEQNRVACYEEWQQKHEAESSTDPQAEHQPERQARLFADWLRAMVSEGKLDTQRRLPPYAVFAQAPFFVNEKTVAQIMRQLRDEGVLPARKKMVRTKRGPGLTQRDIFLLNYIEEMRALRYDQARRVLSRISEGTQGLLSPAQTSHVIRRCMKVGRVCYCRVHANQPGWLLLTRKWVTRTFPIRMPAENTLKRLYWVNEVRLKLEEKHPEMTWISGRGRQGQQAEEQDLEFFVDGLIALSDDDGWSIAVKVQVTKPAPSGVERVMKECVKRCTSGWINYLHYYVSHKALPVVRAVYDRLVKEQCQAKTCITIIELEAFLDDASTVGNRDMPG